MSPADAPLPGRAERLAEGLRRVLAPNPSPMTYWGTNTYLLGENNVAVIDPGPDDPAHLDALLAALGPGERIETILVTHAHLDHSPGAAALSARTGAPVLAFGPADAGRSALMSRLAGTGGLAGGEGVDRGFAPDRELADGAQVQAGGLALEALWTPGHFGNHLCFAAPEQGWLFSGDLVMGWASSLVSPPDGDLGAFMRSLDRLLVRPETRYFPGHGAEIADGPARARALRDHRRERDRQIRTALSEAPGTPEDLARRIYLDTPAALLPAASRNVLAHLIDLHERKLVTSDGPLRFDAVFRPAAAR